MTKRVSVLNGANKAQDYDVVQFENTQLTAGIAEEGDLLVEQQTVPDATVKVAAGICAIEVTRVSDSKTFKVFCENSASLDVTITPTTPANIGAIIAVVPKADVEDGSLNPEAGTGVFSIIYVAGTSGAPLSDGAIDSATSNLYYWIRLANITQDATVATGDISDTRLLIQYKRIVLQHDQSLQSVNDAGTGLVDIIKVTTGNIREVAGLLRYSGAPTPSNDQDLANKKYIDDLLGAIMPTGAIIPYAGASEPSGWLISNGDTIGNAASSGTARANADTETLFTQLWDSFADAELAVSGGRGGSAAADFAADKNIELPDLQERVPVGYKSGGTFDPIGDAGGAETVSHTHDVPHDGWSHDGINNSGALTANNGSNTYDRITNADKASGAASDEANIQPYFVVNYIIKL